MLYCDPLLSGRFTDRAVTILHFLLIQLRFYVNDECDFSNYSSCNQDNIGSSGSRRYHGFVDSDLYWIYLTEILYAPVV